MRLGLDFRPASWLDRAAERKQVESHMRICLDATEGFRSMVTLSPSEPLLAEASWKVMKEKLGPKEAPAALLSHITNSYLSPGDRGEVIAALLLLLARDGAIQARKAGDPTPGGGSPTDISEDYKYDGVTKGRIVTVLEFTDALVPPESRSFVRKRKPSACSPDYPSSTDLASAFDNAHIYFNHFIRVNNYKVVNRKFLWCLICRGAAVICATNQRGIDILIPVLMGTILDPRFVTAIFVQVKNDGTYTRKPCTSLFTMMNPFKVGLFSNSDGKDAVPPVLRIVLALASERSGVTGPGIPTRRSSRLAIKSGGTESNLPTLPKDPRRSPRQATVQPIEAKPTDAPKSLTKAKFTAYDLWIAGVSSRSFGVVPDVVTHDQYRALLDRSRNIFNAYGMLIKGSSKGKNKEHARIQHMLHAGASSEAEHFQNYIRTFHRTVDRSFVAKNFLPDSATKSAGVGMTVDKSEGIDGDWDSDSDSDLDSDPDLDFSSGSDSDLDASVDPNRMDVD